jgi:hypothetical protein
LASEVMVIGRDAALSMGLTGQFPRLVYLPLAVIGTGRQRPVRA